MSRTTRRPLLTTGAHRATQMTSSVHSVKFDRSSYLSDSEVHALVVIRRLLEEMKGKHQ